MPKDTNYNTMEEKLAEQGKEIQEHLHYQLVKSVEKCSTWAYDNLRDKTIIKAENLIRKRIENALENSLNDRVEDALVKFENYISGK